MEQHENFNNISEAISGKYENVVHDVCHVPSVMNLTDFYRIYELEEKAIHEKYDTLPKNAPTVELFAEVFKKFDQYPVNMAKPKKALTMRERLNSTMSRSSPSLNDSSGFTASTVRNKDNSLKVLNKIDDVPTASETLTNFVKFQKHIKQLNAEIIQGVEKEYAIKLKQLNIFAQQLEKLLPAEKVGKSALTPEEENILEDLVNSMDDLNFIRSHQDVLRQQNSIVNYVTPKLENLVDILSYCLLAVNSFNIK